LANAIASRSEIRPSKAWTTSSRRSDAGRCFSRLEGAEIGDVGAVVGNAGEIDARFSAGVGRGIERVIARVDGRVRRIEFERDGLHRPAIVGEDAREDAAAYVHRAREDCGRARVADVRTPLKHVRADDVAAGQTGGTTTDDKDVIGAREGAVIAEDD
jgi:hypothetical protein